MELKTRFYVAIKMEHRKLGTLMLINSRPRKCLNYATLFEKFLHEIKFEKIKKNVAFNIAIYGK